jgi:hypothetical protein
MCRLYLNPFESQYASVGGLGDRYKYQRVMVSHEYGRVRGRFKIGKRREPRQSQMLKPREEITRALLLSLFAL